MKIHRPGTIGAEWNPVAGTDHVVMHSSQLEVPTRWRKRRTAWVCQETDLFHPGVIAEFTSQVWRAMARFPKHTFIVATERPHRMFDLLHGTPHLFPPARHIWVGATVENQEQLDERVPMLLKCPGEVKFVLADPMLSDLYIHPYLHQLEWVVIGGATELSWARHVKDQCAWAETPFFMKDGDIPEDLMVRQWP